MTRRPFTLDTIFNDVHNDTSNSLRSELTDASGNTISSHESADGDYHLGVQLEQNVISDTNNSSTTNLASGATFEGSSTTTLGVVGLQWSLKTSENCTVYIEESPDGTNWDISYSFDYIASKGGRGETVQATQSYWRIRVTNEGMSTTSYFRLQGVLCPIATPLPSELSPDGRLKSESTLSGKENTDRHVWVNPTNELAISPVYRLVGTTFIGAVVDANFWTAAIANDGTVTQGGGLIELKTSATANGEATFTSVRKARFVAGSAMYMAGAVNWVTAGTASNIRRVGAYNDDNGYFFQLSGTTFSVGTRTNATATPVDTLVNSGSFNGNMGDTWSPTANTYYKIAIEWTPLGVLFYIGSSLLHKINGAGLSATQTLPIKLENDNGAITTDISLKSLGLYIARQGELTTNPQYYYFAAGTGSAQLKIGAGAIHAIIFNNVINNAVITLSDSTTTTTPTILAHTAGATKTNVTSIDMRGAPFNDGLRLTVATQNASLTIIYE